MQPSPMADTSRLLMPSLRFFIGSPLNELLMRAHASQYGYFRQCRPLLENSRAFAVLEANVPGGPYSTVTSMDPRRYLAFVIQDFRCQDSRSALAKCAIY